VSPGIICEQDVVIPMRDGTKTYCDVFRPVTTEKVPVIIVYSFYGKRPCADTEGVVYQTLGVPEGTCSPNCKFEGPDPEYWCHQGYAVANYDQRGAVNSEGDIFMCTVEEGIDAYDVCEFLAVQDWCNGKVAFGGNSGLAVIQWKVASERPPHLACIAPWEGNLDTYRHLLSTGGITECGFNPYLFTKLYGTGYMEDHYQMVLEHPYYDAYWEEKVADIEKIEVPAYITGSWSHFHLYGGIDGYAKISSTEKWLRIHREFEWPDQYHRDNLEDLKKFFDRYMKGIRNGWESTPRVRIGVMDAYDKDKETHRVVENFPLPNTQYKKLYLSADGHLKTDLPEEEGQVSYDANIAKPTVTMQDDLTFDLKRVSPPKGDDRATFDLVVTEETELIGFAKLHLWVEAGGSDDLDLFVAIKKLDAEGNWIPTLVMGKPYPGTPGRQRVSLRELDEAKSTEARPYHTLNNPQKLKPGEIVPVDIEIWPSARAWHTGEQIRVEVMGYYERFDWWEPFDYATVNKGRHIIHTGGKYDSYFLIPTQPE
jgi:predicted acyl esterase